LEIIKSEPTQENQEKKAILYLNSIKYFLQSIKDKIRLANEFYETISEKDMIEFLNSKHDE